ncbi:hypothetical protein [Bradyrhizobium sp. JYMT SZCCT0428]|uniref:hypothetical protein n=1 Tax=Bradyrhizobium sp. JYMT SZCCT0428 TaxID=2807673 RepID=UPI001BACC333|nr:hypothetical protein [Bradyrhizobium sp. JYMT SZCCT0428]MBR1151648.1 hypothetical protein [Bradyrhizobium sp. JYMT SZCCT0428]
MERTYEQTDSAIRELKSDEFSTAELEEVAGGLIGLIAVATAAGSTTIGSHLVPEGAASAVTNYFKWLYTNPFEGRK